MKRIALFLLVFFTFCTSVLSQKITEPKLLGSWFAGEDPSEFLFHLVMEVSQSYLKENPEGKLIVRICGADDFSTAFIKSTLDPLAVSKYNVFAPQIITPYEKIFVANSSKCSEKKIVFNEYWFVPGENTLDYSEMFPANSIAHRSFYIDDYEYTSDGYKKRSIEKQEKEFSENTVKFVAELKNNSNAEGFIVHNSKNRRIKRNIEKVRQLLTKENLNLQRVKTILKVRLDIDKKGKLLPVEDEGNSFRRWKF